MGSNIFNPLITEEGAGSSEQGAGKKQKILCSKKGYMQMYLFMEKIEKFVPRLLATRHKMVTLKPLLLSMGCSLFSAPLALLPARSALTASLREDIKRLKHEIVVTKREVVSLVKDHRDYLSQPRNEFTIQGYEIIQNFLDKNECERLIQVTNRYLRDRSYLIQGNCYLACRKDLQDVDKSVQQIINAQEVDDKLSQLFRSCIIEELFERRIGEKLQLLSITIQVDNLDTQSKRGFHNDGVTPSTYKAFVYLNDVDDYGDGPYTVIPGSHRHTFRKVINYLYNRVIIILSKQTIYNRKKDDRKLFYSDKQSVSIFGKAGTLIASNQQLAHKGWHKHDRNKRYALICYLIPKKHYRDQPFKLWSAALSGV